MEEPKKDSILKVLIVLAVSFATTSAGGQVAQRDRAGARFENDIRANNETMSRRFSGPSQQIDTQNTRMRERLNSSNTSRLRRP
jgi:hypothetical protein